MILEGEIDSPLDLDFLESCFTNEELATDFLSSPKTITCTFIHGRYQQMNDLSNMKSEKLTDEEYIEVYNPQEFQTEKNLQVYASNNQQQNLPDLTVIGESIGKLPPCMLANPSPVQFSNPSKISKQNKIQAVVSTSKSVKPKKIVTGTRRNSSTPKTRPSLPTRCKDVACKRGQYYETVKEASQNIVKFPKGRSTYCLCNSAFQYFYQGRWMSSGNISELKKKNK
eukprot:gene10065-2487_t